MRGESWDSSWSCRVSGGSRPSAAPPSPSTRKNLCEGKRPPRIDVISAPAANYVTVNPSAPEIARFFSTTLFTALDDDDDHQTLCTLRPPSFVPRIFLLLSSLSYRHWRVRLLTHYTSLTFYLCPKPYRSSHPVRPSNYPSVPQASYIPIFRIQKSLLSSSSCSAGSSRRTLPYISSCTAAHSKNLVSPGLFLTTVSWHGTATVRIIPSYILTSLLLAVSFLSSWPNLNKCGKRGRRFGFQAFIDTAYVLRSVRRRPSRFTFTLSILDRPNMIMPYVRCFLLDFYPRARNDSLFVFLLAHALH